MIDCRRADFSLPDDAHYLNCAYMGPLSRATQEVGKAAVLRKADPTTIGPDDFFDESERLRTAFGRLIGGDGSRVAIVPAVSYGAAIVARNLQAREGGRVVVAGEQFPSNVYAWRRLCARTGMRLRTVAAPSSARRGQAWNEAILDAIDASTALVALPHVHWTDGTRFDLAAAGRRAREVGAALVIDGTQSIGALPFDVHEIRPDAVLCAAYKWLLGPYGIGFAWLGDRFDDGEPLEETWIGRAGSENFRSLVDYRDGYQPGAARYDVGERSNFILVPMALAALEQVAAWQPGEIQAYCERLLEPVVSPIEELGYSIEAASDRAAHLFGIRPPHGLDLGALDEALRARRVFASLRGSALRVSPNIYNDESDTAALVDALRAAVSRASAPASP